MNYLVQEWIYRGMPKPVESHSKAFDSKKKADKFYSERETHLKGIAKTEKIFPSFVRMFKMKRSDLGKDGWSVDYTIKITDVSNDKVQSERIKEGSWIG